MVLDGLLTSQECDELRQRMAEIVDQMDVPEHCRTTFSTYHDEQLKTQVTLRAQCTLGRVFHSVSDSQFYPAIFLSHAFHQIALEDAGKVPTYVHKRQKVSVFACDRAHVVCTLPLHRFIVFTSTLSVLPLRLIANSYVNSLVSVSGVYFSRL